MTQLYFSKKFDGSLALLGLSEKWGCNPCTRTLHADLVKAGKAVKILRISYAFEIIIPVFDLSNALTILELQ